MSSIISNKTTSTSNQREDKIKTSSTITTIDTINQQQRTNDESEAL